MEQDDDPQLTPALQSEDEHRHLDEHSGDGECVVAGEHRIVGVPQTRGDDQDQQRRPEDARPRLLDDEHRELDQAGADAVRRGIAEEAMSPRVDASLEGSRSLHASDGIGPARQVAER